MTNELDFLVGEVMFNEYQLFIKYKLKLLKL